MKTATGGSRDLRVETISTKEAAQLLGVSNAVILRRISNGELMAAVEGGNYRIPRSVVDAEVGPAPDISVPDVDLHDPIAAVTAIANVDATELPLLLSPEETAQLMRLSISSVRTMIRRQQLPTVDVGKRKMVSTVQLLRLLAGAA